MISSAIFGAAAGTGLALVVAMTIVVYRYYAVKRKTKWNWSNLDRWPDPPSKNVDDDQPRHHHHCHTAPASHVFDCWRKPKKSYYAVQTAEFNVAKEQHTVQPSTNESGLPHQSRSYPGGGGNSGRTLARNSSVSSQSSLEGTSCPSSHRGSSPQIRAFGPDGHHARHDPLHAASSYPPSRSSRSPSPARAASLDARCASPASYSSSLHSGNASPSQISLSSVATGVSSTCACSPMNAVQSTSRQTSRCLSPLLIPPPRASISSDGGPIPPASPLGSLQPDLYQRRDVCVFLNAHRTGKYLGKLHLRLRYDFDKSDLEVHLIEAQELASCDQGGFNDPYVKLNLSPEVDSRKRQTEIHRNNPNPSFNQSFKFPVSYEELQEKTLVLQVFDYDRFSRNDVVGSLRVAMNSLELVSSTSSVEVWGEIAGERKPPEEIQEVLVSLSYLPSAERLTVLMIKARNLFPQQDKETLDSFAKVSLLCGEKKVKKKKKTAVRRATINPVWNEAMSFNIPASSLASSAIEICVLDSSSELIGGNAIVGSCIIGPATGADNTSGNSQGREHWLQMTQSPRKQIAEWHTLH
ncbi:synaptotagmin-6 isoform X1 [Linepithema humile]|uniref:synaptotagmin-6 isoform X1 n=1 Tax=Linepithema humile TaxID=83485 RepID=UPI00062375C2|nr:PREDICTED: synaptotagmin-6 isoform X1 [Linepithema humile]XP_012215241.1 PREDICTED: synaptotagmin-6 isoform X1 [Linepithema humile]XP_012215242.1 PREDICTED: synaptotagmin-6 isoform X1 [Linepithema humile]